MNKLGSRLAAALLLASGACAGPAPEEAPADLSVPSPSRVTLRARAGVLGEGARLADGAVLPSESGADLRFSQAMVMSLRSPTPESICARGRFAALADVPSDLEGCAGQAAWQQFVYLDASTIHTLAESRSAGLGLLVRDRDHGATYRVRIVGDAYSVEDGASVVFDIARLP